MYTTHVTRLANKLDAAVLKGNLNEVKQTCKYIISHNDSLRGKLLFGVESTYYTLLNDAFKYPEIFRYLLYQSKLDVDLLLEQQYTKLFSTAVKNNFDEIAKILIGDCWLKTSTLKFFVSISIASRRLDLVKMIVDNSDDILPTSGPLRQPSYGFISQIVSKLINGGDYYTFIDYFFNHPKFDKTKVYIDFLSNRETYTQLPYLSSNTVDWVISYLEMHPEINVNPIKKLVAEGVL
jgi:hypothetical protein